MSSRDFCEEPRCAEILGQCCRRAGQWQSSLPKRSGDSLQQRHLGSLTGPMVKLTQLQEPSQWASAIFAPSAG
jgi:hypothetical protein